VSGGSIEYTVLIAEDYPDFRARIVGLLEPLALTCVPVANGRLAIEVIRDLSRELHLLVTDMDMPVFTGWDVIDAAREHRPSLPVIMQTGEARYTYVRRKADQYGIALIDKTDVDSHLPAAVRQALRLP
jgi:CheY-like chemotaxis protein